MKEKILKYIDPVILVLICAMIVYIPISNALISVFGIMAFVLFMVKKFLDRDFSIFRQYSWLFLILAAFYFLMALSLINSGPNLKISLKALFFKWGRFPFLLWMILDIFKNKTRIMTAVFVLLSSAALVSLSAISQKLWNFEFIHHKSMFGSCVTGPFKNPNLLSAYLTGLIPVGFALAFWSWSRKYLKFGNSVIFILFIAVSALTYCRGGWVGCIVGILTVVLLYYFHKLPQRFFWALMVWVYLFLMPMVAASLYYFRHRGDSERFIIYRGAWKMIEEHPMIGVGLGTFMANCLKYTNNFGIYYTHNCYLQIWAESGIFSLLCFLALMGYILLKNVRLIRQLPNSLEKCALIGLTSGLMGFLVHCFFEIQLYSYPLSILFWTLTGLSLALNTVLAPIPERHK